MLQKVSEGIKSFCEAIDNLHYASVHIEYHIVGINEYIGIASVFDGKKWVEVYRVQGNREASMELKIMIYIINQLNAIAMERNDISFTSVYTKKPQVIQRLVSKGVLIQNKTEYIVSTTDIGFLMIDYLLNLLGYTTRVQHGSYVFERII